MEKTKATHCLPEAIRFSAIGMHGLSFFLADLAFVSLTKLTKVATKILCYSFCLLALRCGHVEPSWPLTYYGHEADLVLLISLPPCLECWDHKHAPPYPAHLMPELALKGTCVGSGHLSNFLFPFVQAQQRGGKESRQVSPVPRHVRLDLKIPREKPTTPLPSRSKWGSHYNLTQSLVKVTNSSALYDSQRDCLDQTDSWCSLQKNANICRETEIVNIGGGQVGKMLEKSNGAWCTA